MAEERLSSRRPAVDLNMASEAELIERGLLPREMAQRIVAGRPYAMPEDLLRRPELQRPSWAPSIVKLLLDGRAAGMDAGLAASAGAMRRVHPSGVVVGVERGERPRVFLAHPLGQELVSAFVAAD